MSKLNLTVQRKAIYDIVHNSDDHPTAMDVMERLKNAGYNFAYGTIYNSLRYLTDTGLIRELKLGDSISRYDGRTDEHQHIVCEKSGRVDEICSELPQEWVKTVANETKYRIESSQVVFTGLCEACRLELAD